MHFAAKGHETYVIDNYLRRTIASETASEPLVSPLPLEERASLFEALTGKKITVKILDCNDYDALNRVVAEFQPEAVVHYAEQPSAPYSMQDVASARRTLDNNLGATFNIIWAVKESAPDCHIIKLGTMGEYGTPNIDIEEGWIDIEHNGRSDKFLYPRQASSFYHTTKILDTDMLWFYVRTSQLRVTDLMQGPVYGMETAETAIDERLQTIFNYDDIFGTVVNRFIAQAVAGIPLTVYGKGGQTRGYLNLKDTLQCVELAALNPADKGELRILNQFTEHFSVNQLADKVYEAGQAIGLDVEIANVDNPRMEKEDHYYNPKHHGLLELGLTPHLLTQDVVEQMIQFALRYKDAIQTDKILPRVRWK